MLSVVMLSVVAPRGQVGPDKFLNLQNHKNVNNSITTKTKEKRALRNNPERNNPERNNPTCNNPKHM
jgi:hypothetical protein